MTSPVAHTYPDFLNIDGLLTSEQKMVRQSVREFVQSEVEPKIADYYIREDFPTHVIPKMGELGLYGSNLEGYGLPGLDNIAYGLIMQELERCDSGLRSFASVQGALVMYPIHAFGSEAQKSEWLPKLGRGEVIGCFGLTESEGGSDPGAMKTRAELKGNEWVINGSKMWITNGNLAQVAVVWAQTEEGIRGFIIPTSTKGFTVRKMTNKLSLRASVTSELYFDNVRVPKDAMLPKSDGLKSPLSCLTQARYGIAWGAIGAAESCYDEVVKYTSDRVLFGKPLAHKQLIQAKLARALSRITQAKLLALRLGQLKNDHELHFAQVSMGKQNNVEMALEISRVCRDMLGGNGIMAEYKTMRHMCNLETVYTYEGTNDVHLLIIGSQITGVQAF
jgi:alkylation response protein AidB-like acyl-CoA dehydrogenase